MAKEIKSGVVREHGKFFGGSWQERPVVVTDARALRDARKLQSKGELPEHRNTARDRRGAVRGPTRNQARQLRNNIPGFKRTAAERDYEKKLASDQAKVDLAARELIHEPHFDSFVTIKCGVCKRARTLRISVDLDAAVIPKATHDRRPRHHAEECRMFIAVITARVEVKKKLQFKKMTRLVNVNPENVDGLQEDDSVGGNL